MNAVDASQHYEQASNEQNPSLLTIILDTNPAAWSLLSGTIPLSKTMANVLIFINAHLACNYTNRIAVIASHCDTAQWLYPTAAEQHGPRTRSAKRGPDEEALTSTDQLSEPTKRLKINGPREEATNPVKPQFPNNSDNPINSDKYRPFRLVEEELLRNLSMLLSGTDPAMISPTTSTMVAGALTLALSYINRQNVAFAESSGGAAARTLDSAPANASSRAADAANKSVLHSRILLISVSPSHDLAHQYIPIMNSIFACQRLSIPIDICQIPTPNAPASSTVFLQQASDATNGIYIPLSTATSGALLQYLMMAFLPTQSSRLYLVLPTRIDVDFRAACFCHRRVVDIGFVCSICLSIFCSVPENGDCLTCGTHLEMGDYGGRPMVVPRQKKRKKNRTNLDGSRISTPTPGPS